MWSKGNKPTQAQIEFREWLREQKCCLGYGDINIQIHHPIGSSAREFGVNVGNWFMLPCTEPAHRELERMTLTTQRQLFAELCATYHKRFYSLPFDKTVLLGIMVYSKTGSRG